MPNISPTHRKPSRRKQSSNALKAAGLRGSSDAGAGRLHAHSPNAILIDFTPITPGTRERIGPMVMSDESIDCCQELTTFPTRGADRSDLLPGLRIVGFERRVTIAFIVRADTVPIEGIFYGGQDFETKLGRL